MATIRSAIEVQDRFSSALNSLYAGLDRAVNKFETLQNVMSRSANFDVGSNLRTDLNSANTAISNINNNLNNVNNTLNNTENNLTQVNSTINNVNTNIINIANNQQKFNDTVNKSNSSMDGLIGKVKTLVGAYLGMQAIKGILNTSDELVQTKARLDLMNDGLQTTEQLQNEIFQSAQRSRGAYASTASTVAKLGLLAKDAFSNNQETIAFAEQLNKQFTISGASAQGVEAATLQLTQALASGVLRGEELNSVFENAPTVIQAIADYLDKPIGQIRNMASEGQITADIVKKAMFAAADETNSKFESMPKTISQIWTSIKNDALMAFQPILLKINDIANNQGFITLTNNIATGCSFIAVQLLNIINLVCSVSQFFSDNWSIISPIVYGIVGALGAYLVVMTLIKLAHIATAISAGTASLAANIYAASLGYQAGATFSATVAQYGLNAALLACPITWIILAVISLIAIFYSVIGVINKVTGSSISATGIIAGVFWSLGTTLYNIVAYVWNVFASLAEFLANVFVNPVYSVKALFANLATNVLDMCISMTSGIDGFATNLANGIVDGVNIAIRALNWLVEMINKIPGMNLPSMSEYGKISSVTSSLQGAKSNVQNWLGDKPSNYIEIPKMKMKSIGQSYNNGYNVGSNLVSDIKDMFSNANGNNDNTAFNYDDLLSAAEGANKGAGDTANNTGAIKDALDITDEDLKYLRDIAEQEVINRFTTAEIKVEMINNNTVNSDLDLDSICDTLAVKVEEQMNISAEGVHE